MDKNLSLNSFLFCVGYYGFQFVSRKLPGKVYILDSQFFKEIHLQRVVGCHLGGGMELKFR